MGQPITPWLQTCKARYSTKQHEIKLSTREKNDAVKRCHKPETYEAAASITQHSFTPNFLNK